MKTKKYKKAVSSRSTWICKQFILKNVLKQLKTKALF